MQNVGILTPNANVLLDVSALLVVMGCGFCRYVPRFGNKAAHELASFAFNIVDIIR